MEKQILHQRFNYAELIPYKDRSKISSRPKNLGLNTFDITDTVEEKDENEIFGEKMKLVSVSTPKVTINLDSKNDVKRKNTKYFNSGEETGVRIPLEPYFKDCRNYLTTSDRHIKNHYGRAFTSVALHIYERTIYLKNDKITVKLNHYHRNRYFNCKYYKKHFNCEGFTIDLKNGVIYTFSRNKATGGKVRKNSFYFLKSVLDNSISFFEKKIIYLTDISQDDKVKDSKHMSDFRKEFKDAFDDSEFISSLCEAFKMIPGVKIETPQRSHPDLNKEWIYKSIIHCFVTLNKIKVPNYYHKLVSEWYPTKVYLKKNDNKLIASILDRLHIKSKHTIKLIHENPDMGIERLYSYTKYFGFKDFHKYISNLNPYLYTYPEPSRNAYQHPPTYPHPSTITIHNLNDEEKHNFLKLMNDFFEQNNSHLINPISFDNILSSQLRQVDDHIRMLNRIREYDDDIRFRAQTIADFHQEHLEFARREGLIRRGYVIEHVFDEKLIDSIEEPILIGNVRYYPVILKKDTEYTSEGQHMHHCVGGYADNDRSIIVSIRHQSKDGAERITCEYSTLDRRCIQDRYFCNGTPPEHFNEPLSIVTNRVIEYKDTFKSKEKIKTPIVTVNGKTIQENAGLVETLF